MCNLFIPIQTLNIIRTGSGTESVWVCDIVQIGDVELFQAISNASLRVHNPDLVKYLSFCATGGQQIGMSGVELEGLDGARVFGGPRDHGVVTFR